MPVFTILSVTSVILGLGLVLCLVGGWCFYKRQALKYRALLTAIAQSQPEQSALGKSERSYSSMARRSATIAIKSDYDDLIVEAIVLKLTYQSIIDQHESIEKCPK